mmetsp:Transcript_3174/g.4689  ORF Transcript_3174/g.4689 Transcript_3174/m.4689 type:complete len:109 (-) Transcript_3174:1873-2199(-)
MPKEILKDIKMNKVVHDTEKKRFYFPSEHGEAELIYSIHEDNPNLLIYSHIFVPKELRGKGISTKLAIFAFNYAITFQKKLFLSCSYLRNKFYPLHQEKYKSIVVDSL